ncbi:tetratricopeptide repeat protein [Alsobacter sp. SYSU M60028]|uniref:Tetratricopeptide repeat protein n=1 Tax=Alsobacter ponti TaxID=2962936 RepID=A0ABT1LEH7_9HYPH|nr:cytochrome c3 family protein [Alsobacter ponti]MCP8939834.1 tetratricopeptide repeat protein [Alsobacter ponti]
MSAASFSPLRVALWALLCVAAVFGVGLVHGQAPAPAVKVGELAPSAPQGFVGSQACASCHEAQAAAWRASQHAAAMQPATPEAVLGDFSDVAAEHFGSKARFLREGDDYVVETEGRDGKTARFRVAYTFGVAPLQQYLTEFPDGRLQALPYAWDTRTRAEGGQRWFHLYPGEAIPPGDVLHWTGLQQNWNFMCADCHSTAVSKGYKPSDNRFETRFAEVSVGCEACHGPGEGHVKWAEGGREPGAPRKGFASAATPRPAADWTPDPATGSPAHGVARRVGDEVDTCGTCHSRRGQFAEGWRPGSPLADFYRTVFLTPDLFEDDGQMKDEVFNLASFQQSRMHARGVTCGDCHDPHSARLKADGAQVCGQCHSAEVFASVRHTGHAQGPGQPDCVSCHMPARTYMVVDRRHDHSFRVPRPDLTVSLGTPNACNDCHRDKPAAWAASAVEAWHGPVRKGAQTYAPAFHAARTGDPRARDLLLAVSADKATPALARATALLFLRERPAAAVDGAMSANLADPDPMIRIAALGGLAGLPPDQRWRRAAGLLGDPVRSVRMQAAVTLAEGPPPGASPAERQAFEAAAAEYEAGERFNADRPEHRANLARFLAQRGRTAEAEREYLAALKLGFSVPVRVDLADFYRSLGRESDAEILLRQTIAMDPTAAAPRHALGLALVRARRQAEALEQLRLAAERDPGQSRYAYVYAVALASVGRADEAGRVLEKALQSNPSDAEVTALLLQNALKARDLARAAPLAQRLRVLVPDDPGVARLAAQLSAAGARPAP